VEAVAMTFDSLVT